MADDILPRLKKKLAAFLKREEGKISKQSAATLGAVVTGAAIAGALGAKTVKAHPLTIDTGEGSTGSVSGSHGHY